MNSVEIPRLFNNFTDFSLLWIIALFHHTTNSLLESLLLMCAFLRLITNQMNDFSLKRFICSIYFIVASLWECSHYAHAKIVRIFTSHCLLSFWRPPVGLETPTWNWELIQENNFVFQFQEFVNYPCSFDHLQSFFRIEQFYIGSWHFLIWKVQFIM